ncbi:MAG: SDR family NAD(P)-dependent oxidoreductase [Chloroflexi bacterium]|nr:SDR family NAD(P)-dependent oxidoreductase [Chloroflexota bacterium]
MSNVQGKVVIVTGASSGIGEAAARLFGEAGAKVVIAARRVERLEAVAKGIEEAGAGAEALVIAADLSKLADIQSLVERTLGRFGRIDVLVNNAGFGRLNFLDRLDPIEDIEPQYRVNVLGYVLTTRLVLPMMMKQKSGHIINVASMAGKVATPTYTIYASCKFAIDGFSQALRREAAPWGIKVSVIYPTAVVTEFNQHAGIQRKTKYTTPKSLLLTADDVGRAVLSLAARDRSAEVLMPGVNFFTKHINQSLPWLVDWLTIRNFTIPEREEELREAGLL